MIATPYNRILLLAMVSAILTGCASEDALTRQVERAKNSPAGKLRMEAVAHFYKNLENGNIPGITDGEHGKLECYLGGEETNQEIEFPVQVELLVWKKQDNNSVYHYAYSKQEKKAAWVLVKAFKADSTGNNQVDLVTQK